MRKQTLNKFALLCGIGLLSLSPVLSFAETGVNLLNKLSESEGNAKVGALRVLPGFFVEESHTNNLYATSKTTASNASTFYTVLTPGIMFKLPVKDHEFSLGASGERYIYSKYGKENYWASTLMGDATFNFNRLTLSFDDTYLKTKDFRATEDTLLRASHIDNGAQAMLNYTFPSEKFAFEFLHRNELMKYDQADNKAQNKSVMRYSGNVSYKLTAKTSIFVGASYDYVDFFDNPNSTNANFGNTSYFGGVRWAATAKTTGELKFGSGKRNYKNRADADGNAYLNKGTWYGQAKIDYELKEGSKLIFTFLKGYMESTYGGSTANGISKTSGYDSTAGGVSGEFTITPKVLAALSYNYENASYDALQSTLTKRKDTNSTYTGKVIWKPRNWIEVIPYVSNNDRKSNDSARKMTINTYGLNIGFVY